MEGDSKNSIAIQPLNGDSPSRGGTMERDKDCEAIHGACCGESTSLLPKEEEMKDSIAVQPLNGGSPSKGTTERDKDCEAIQGACCGESTSLLPKEEEMKDSKAVQPLNGGSPSKGTTEREKDSEAIQGVCCGESTSLLPKEKEEMKGAISFAKEREQRLQKITSNFETMGILRLILDSKVPQKDKKWYYLFTFTPSNRLDVIFEVEKYLDFYEQMETDVRKIRYDDEKSEEERENPHVIVVALKRKLKDMLDAAKLGVNFTSSSALYKLHKQFTEEHDQLEVIIKSMEIISLKQEVTTMTKRWQESIQAIERLSARLETFEQYSDAMNRRLDTVLGENEENDKELESEQEFSALLADWVKQQLNKDNQLFGN